MSDGEKEVCPHCDGLVDTTTEEMVDQVQIKCKKCGTVLDVIWKEDLRD